MKENISELKKIVEQIHKCQAQFIESVPVLETFEGQIVSQGIVNLFSLKGHAEANKCYAWSSVIDGSMAKLSILHRS